MFPPTSASSASLTVASIVVGLAGLTNLDMRQPCRWLPDYRLVRQQCQCSIRSGNRIRSAAIAAAPERQYLASLRSGLWDLLANDYAATCLDASFVAAISARR